MKEVEVVINSYYTDTIEQVGLTLTPEKNPQESYRWFLQPFPLYTVKQFLKRLPENSGRHFVSRKGGHSCLTDNGLTSVLLPDQDRTLDQMWPSYFEVC